MRYKTPLRYELKYLLTRDQQAAVIKELAAHMEPDVHGDAVGGYLITSIYFDTANYKAYWDKLEGHRLRRKVRVRVYGDTVVGEETPCYLEIKERRNKMMAKPRVVLPYAQAVALEKLENIAADVSDSGREVINEVSYLYHTLQLKAACVVRYRRLAFSGREPHADLRVTFDTNLRGRIHDLSLLSGGQAENHYFMPPHISIMEIKTNRNVPTWLARILTKERCTPRRISKYCATLEQSGAIQQRQRIMVAGN